MSNFSLSGLILKQHALACPISIAVSKAWGYNNLQGETMRPRKGVLFLFFLAQLPFFGMAADPKLNPNGSFDAAYVQPKPMSGPVRANSISRLVGKIALCRSLIQLPADPVTNGSLLAGAVNTSLTDKAPISEIPSNFTPIWSQVRGSPRLSEGQRTSNGIVWNQVDQDGWTLSSYDGQAGPAVVLTQAQFIGTKGIVFEARVPDNSGQRIAVSDSEIVWQAISLEKLVNNFKVLTLGENFNASTNQVDRAITEKVWTDKTSEVLDGLPQEKKVKIVGPSFNMPAFLNPGRNPSPPAGQTQEVPLSVAEIFNSNPSAIEHLEYNQSLNQIGYYDSSSRKVPVSRSELLDRLINLDLAELPSGTQRATAGFPQGEILQAQLASGDSRTLTFEKLEWENVAKILPQRSIEGGERVVDGVFQKLVIPVLDEAFLIGKPIRGKDMEILQSSVNSLVVEFKAKTKRTDIEEVGASAGISGMPGSLGRNPSSSSFTGQKISSLALSSMVQTVEKMQCQSYSCPRTMAFNSGGSDNIGEYRGQVKDDDATLCLYHSFFDGDPFSGAWDRFQKKTVGVCKCCETDNLAKIKANGDC